MYCFIPSSNRIVNWAEETDQRLSEDKHVRGLVDSCVSDTDSGRASQKTFQIFQEIVRIVLECDENGLREFLHGRQHQFASCLHPLLLKQHCVGIGGGGGGGGGGGVSHP